MSLGIPCPRCGQPLSLTSQTRQRASDGTVRRRRTCTNCGHRFTTRETLEGSHVPAAAARALEERLHHAHRAIHGDFDNTGGTT